MQALTQQWKSMIMEDLHLRWRIEEEARKPETAAEDWEEWLIEVYDALSRPFAAHSLP
jgi:hypothetical protein